MTREWDAEHVVGPDRAAALVGEQFPALRGFPVEPLAQGWDNSVHLVGGEWVFRFPRRAVALAGVRREIAVLPVVAPGLPLPVPVPELVGEPAGDYPWPFWGARLVRGTELADARVSDEARVPVGRRTGEFLRALHGAAPGVGLPRGADGRRATAGARRPARATPARRRGRCRLRRDRLG